METPTEASSTPTAEGHVEDANGSDIILAISCAFLIGLLIRTVGGLLPRKIKVVPLPYTALMLVFGCATGAVTVYGSSVNYITPGIEMLESISPSVIFAVFIPALIFPSGLGLNWWVVRHVLDKAVLLAVAGTALQTALIALIARFVLPYGWSWAGSWLFGSILAATDPVAVVAIMHSCGASVKLATTIEGEALLNDGVAYVLFEIFLGWAEGEPVKAGAVVGFAFKAALGGPLLGLAWAGALILWLRILFNDAITEITATLVAAYTLWLVSDEMLGCSGMLSLVFFAAAMGAYGKYMISRSAAPSFSFFFEFVDFSANSLIFFLSGLLIAIELSKANDRSSDTIVGIDWAWAAALWALLLVIRAFMVAVFFPILCLGSYGLNWRDAIVLSWAGLRGAVGLTLALIVLKSPNVQDEAYRDRLFFFVAFMAVATLLIQGSTTTLLLKVLGYLHLPAAKQNAMLQSAAAVERLGRRGIKEAEENKDNLLGDADWEQVEKLTSLEVAKAVLKRPVRGTRTLRHADAILHDSGEVGHRHQLGESRNEVLEDLRERLCQAVHAQYSEAFDQDFLSPSQAYVLRDSINYALDNLGERLTDWEALHHRLLPLHQARGEKKRRLSYFLQRAMAWIQGERQTAMKDAVMVSTFAYAHAQARRDLVAFANIEMGNLGDIEAMENRQGEGEAGHGEGSSNNGPDVSNGACHSSQGEATQAKGPPRQSPGMEAIRDNDVSLDDLNAVWNTDDAKVLSHAANTTHNLASRPSLLRRLATADRSSIAELQGCLEEVLEESRCEQRLAEQYLEELKVQHPQAVKKARTEQVAVEVLHRERSLLERLHKGGLLEEKEVEDPLNKVEMRMKNMHTLFSIE